ncbi:MAG: hypothetical protein ABR529_00985 [Actinomycetota bacterium]
MRLLAQLHAGGGWVVVAVTVCFLLAAIVHARFLDPPSWFERARGLVTIVVGVQILLGALTYGEGARPSDSLHLLYGVAALGALPLANTFASEAPPRARSGALAAGALVTLALAWRLFATA